MLDADRWLSWQPWRALNGCWRGTAIPALPGLYRIRRCGHENLDYIGQTGAGTMTLRKRLAMLAGVYAEEMPYRDPHTAAPALWALQASTGCTFEVSVVPIVGSTPWRKGLEALAISLYRQQYGQSPTINFGRMPSGYRMSSANNTMLVQRGARFRGGLTTEAHASHMPGIPPIGLLTADTTAEDWCGHRWSEWTKLDFASREVPADAMGLYRIRAADQPILLYIGQGKLRSRLMAHLARVKQPNHPQGNIFSMAEPLECSWVIGNGWAPNQCLELENDLIAAYVLYIEHIPSAQFIG